MILGVLIAVAFAVYIAIVFWICRRLKQEDDERPLLSLMEEHELRLAPREGRGLAPRREAKNNHWAA